MHSPQVGSVHRSPHQPVTGHAPRLHRVEKDRREYWAWMSEAFRDFSSSFKKAPWIVLLSGFNHIMQHQLNKILHQQLGCMTCIQTLFLGSKYEFEIKGKWCCVDFDVLVNYFCAWFVVAIHNGTMMCVFLFHFCLFCLVFMLSFYKFNILSLLLLKTQAAQSCFMKVF